MARQRQVNERTRRINFPAKRTFFALDIDLHIACGVRIFSARQNRKKEGGGGEYFHADVFEGDRTGWRKKRRKEWGWHKRKIRNSSSNIQRKLLDWARMGLDCLVVAAVWFTNMDAPDLYYSVNNKVRQQGGGIAPKWRNHFPFKKIFFFSVNRVSAFCSSRNPPWRSGTFERYSSLSLYSFTSLRPDWNYWPGL